MRISAGTATHRPGNSPLEELERVDEALSHFRHLANVQLFVDGQTGPAVTLATAAQAIGISQSHLARLFQEKVGMSFHRWLTLRRVRTAMSLMREQPTTAFQAAHMTGFTSYRSFARVFKSVVGVPPSIYRKRVEQRLAAQLRK